MESPGCYWKPVLHILEDDPEYRLAGVLANAQQVKAVTGHKTDPHEARWLAHGLRHGMIRPSCIPPRAQRELRDLTRRRKQMVRAAAEERHRVQKVWEDANVKPIECWGGGPASTGACPEKDCRTHGGPGRPSDAGCASISDHARHAAQGLSGRRD